MASGDSIMALDALFHRPPTTDFATLDNRGEVVVLDFDDATDEQAQFFVIVPSHFGGGDLQVVLTWTSTSATSGNCKWQGELTRLAAGDNLDSLPAVDGSDSSVADAPSTSGDLVTTTLDPISVSGLVAGDMLQVLVNRLATDVADTLVGDAELVGLELREA